MGLMDRGARVQVQARTLLTISGTASDSAAGGSWQAASCAATAEA